FLRLDSTKALKEHVGHEVSVSGMADFTDLDKGTLEASNDGATVTVTLKSERKSVTAVGSAGDPPKTAVGTSGKAEVPTYKMKVRSVSMRAPPCAPYPSRLRPARRLPGSCRAGRARAPSRRCIRRSCRADRPAASAAPSAARRGRRARRRSSAATRPPR